MDSAAWHWWYCKLVRVVKLLLLLLTRWWRWWLSSAVELTLARIKLLVVPGDRGAARTCSVIIRILTGWHQVLTWLLLLLRLVRIELVLVTL